MEDGQGNHRPVLIQRIFDGSCQGEYQDAYWSSCMRDVSVCGVRYALRVDCSQGLSLRYGPRTLLAWRQGCRVQAQNGPSALLR